MTIDTILSLFPMPTFAPAGEGDGGGEGDGDGATNTGDTKDGDGGDADGQNNGDKSGDTSGDGTVLDGGTADGEDNSGEGEGDGDKSKDKSEDDKDGEGDEPEVPEAYDFTELMPEGVELDTGMVEAMSPAMKELKLTQDQANSLVKAYIEQQTKDAEAQAEAVVTMMKGWVDTAKADKEIGHANWDDSVRAANAFIKKFGTPEFTDQVLKGQGMGNHPEMIRIFARAGKAVADDIAPSGEGTDTSPKDKASAWYGDTTPNSKKG